MGEHQNLCAQILAKLPLDCRSPPNEKYRLPIDQLEENLKIIHGWLSKDELTKFLYERVKSEKLPYDFFVLFRKTILSFGIPLPDSILRKGDDFIKEEPTSTINIQTQQKKKKTKKEKPKKEKKEKINTPTYSIPNGKLQIGTYLKGKQIFNNNQNKSLKIKYYALFFGSNMIYIYNSSDDAPNHIFNVINLEPCFSVKPLPKQKNNWEFRLNTLKDEYQFSTSDESTFRKWLVQLDKRINESIMSEEDKNEKQATLLSLENKLHTLEAEMKETKMRLKQNYDNPVASDSKRLEELMVAIQNVTSCIQMLNE